jgi:hypothetical protein
MRRFILIWWLLGVVWIPLSADSCVSASGEPITFGAVFSQESLLLPTSTHAVDAMLAMTEVYNECNNGARPIAWQIERVTTYSDALAAASQLSESGIPLIIGSGLESISSGLIDGLNGHETVFFDITERPPRLQTSPWFFSLRPDDYTLGIRTAQFIRETIASSILDEPVRLALVQENTPRATAIAYALREQLGQAIVVDDTRPNSPQLAVQIREADANVLLLISRSESAANLWHAMRQADANVDAWIYLGEELFYSRINSPGVLIIKTQHFATESLAQVVEPAIYERFIDKFTALAGDSPDTEAFGAALGTYYLLFSVLSEISTDTITAEDLRMAFRSTSDIDVFGMADFPALSVSQHQRSGYCLVAPIPYATCREPAQPFPTWRGRITNP